MQGKASASDEDTSGEVSDVAADDDYIPDCVGLTREKWCKKEVTLLNEGGEGVATGFVEFARSSQTVDGRSTLGDYNVGVVVCEVIQGQPSVRSRSLLSWPIKRTLYQGVSLYDHQRKERSIQLERALRLGDRCGSRKYDSTGRTRRLCLPKRKDKLIDIRSVNEVAFTGCCKRLCLEQFDAALIYTLRHEMHHSDSKSKDAIRLAVHRHCRRISGESRRFCVLEGKLVCMLAWRKIYGVSKTDFYRYKQYAASGRRAQFHAGKGRTKARVSKQQAVQTMKMLLETKADPMPHRTCNLKTGEKVVQKILPSGTKWKQILETVNEVISLTSLLGDERLRHFPSVLWALR
jgi:hypothetical protein